MSNRAHRRPPVDLSPEQPLRRGQKAWLFVVWFFAARTFPKAWRRKPYLRDRGGRPGRSGRRL